jgi:hypothetical protein
VELGLRCIIWRSSDLSLPFSRLYKPCLFAPFPPLPLRFSLIVFFRARIAQQNLNATRVRSQYGRRPFCDRRTSGDYSIECIAQPVDSSAARHQNESTELSNCTCYISILWVLRCSDFPCAIPPQTVVTHRNAHVWLSGGTICTLLRHLPRRHLPWTRAVHFSTFCILTFILLLLDTQK